MNIRNISSLKETAAQRLDQAGQSKRIAAIYAGITVGASALVTLANYVLDLRIDQSGGLSNMGIRSILSTVSTMLPMILSVVLMCLDVGYLGGMLRISRGRYASPNCLRTGFERFWTLLRYSILQGCIFFFLMVLSVYAAVQIFLLTPLSEPAMELLIPLAQEGTIDMAALAESPVYAELMSAVLPAVILSGIMCMALIIPVAYQYRMTYYVILDKPGMGAMAAMRESKKMMRRNRFNLFRMDLSFWWYHGLCFLASCICYGDSLLPMIGVELPFSADVSYFIFYFLFLAAEFAIYFYLRNRVEVTYALAYEAIKPEEPKNNEIVLGNIFQM